MKISALLLAFLLLCTWAMAVTGFPLALGLFSSVNIEMPALTLISLSLLQPIWLWLCTALVALSGFLLARRTQIGCNLSLAVCLLCNFFVVSLALPLFALWKLIGTSAITSSHGLMIIAGNSGVLLLLAAAAFAQGLFVVLVTKRREFTETV